MINVRITRKAKKIVTRLAIGPATGKQIMEDTDLAPGSFYPESERLVDSGWMIYRPEGSLYVITDAGQRMAARFQAQRERKRVRRS